MFGYVVINESELKIKDYRRYRGVYCGLCQTLKHTYGPFGQLCLNYDMTFGALMLMGLYDDELTMKERDYRCGLHPLRKIHLYENEAIGYAADMTVLMSYYLFRDHWVDDRNVAAFLEMKILKHKIRKTAAKYPRQFKAIKRYVYRLSKAEARDEVDLDVISGLTGTMLGELFNWKDDVWADMLRRTGFYLGKFIYLMDAYEDLEKDVEKKRFNPLIPYMDRPDFEQWLYNVLDLMMADCARQFEQLPILSDIEILRNILYSGVWSKYVMIRNAKNKTEEVKDESL